MYFLTILSLVLVFMVGQTAQAKSEFQQKLEQIVASQKAISKKIEENKGNSETDLKYCKKFENVPVDHNGYCKVFLLSEVTVPAKTVVRFKPEYSAEIYDNVTGYIVAEYTVDGFGGVMDFNIVESVPDGAFDKKVTTKALKRWKYKPAELNGQKVRQRTNIRIDFNPPQAPKVSFY